MGTCVTVRLILSPEQAYRDAASATRKLSQASVRHTPIYPYNHAPGGWGGLCFLRVFFWGGRETKGHLLWGARINLLVPATAAIPFSRFFRRSVLPWFCGGQQSGVLLLIKHCGVAVSKCFPQLALSSQESVMIPVKRPLLW